MLWNVVDYYKQADMLVLIAIVLMTCLSVWVTQGQTMIYLPAPRRCNMASVFYSEAVEHLFMASANDVSAKLNELNYVMNISAFYEVE